MAKYEITSPDGVRYQVEAPDDATQEQVVEYFQQQTAGQDQVEVGGAPVEPPAAEQDPNFFQRVDEAWTQREQNVDEMVSRNLKGNTIEDVMNVPKMGALAAGQVAGGVVDFFVEGIESAYKTVVPDAAQEKIMEGFRSLAETEVGQQGIKALQAGGEAYGKFKEMYPDAAMALEGGVNVAMASPALKAGKVKVGKSAEGLAKQTSAEIKTGIDKSVRPSVAGKHTFSQSQKYLADAEKAVNTIVKNKNALKLTDEFGEAVKGKLPENLRQFSQAVEQSKKAIYSQYDDLAKVSGKAGAKVKLKPITEELKKVVQSKPLRDVAPEIVNYTGKRMKTLAKRGAYTTDEAQEAIKFLNSSLESFYRNPTYETASKAYIDSVIVNNMRASLDDVITKASGKGYQSLKKEYGALKAIEKDVAHRAVVDARQAGKSLIDFTDVFTGERAIQGLMTMNPATVGQATAMKSIANFIKWVNDPNRIVKSMFQKAEKGAKAVPKEITVPKPGPSAPAIAAKAAADNDPLGIR